VHFYVPCGSGPCLLAEVGSGDSTCHMAPDPISRLERASVLPHVPLL
jgi:hypothetical protein